ncbi:hypothetical protein BC831DRAFT_427395 [Entophlyctis helioformis]|nr:hypothetical protein BC831DRAFT_427395 [Entophlyctis helioformis]
MLFSDGCSSNSNRRSRRSITAAAVQRFNKHSILPWICLAVIFGAVVHAAQWTPENAPFNLNQIQRVDDPLDFATDWTGPYTPSPDNWRFPFYTIMPDRYADGDPTNNDVLGTPWEWDPRQTNFRHGGDVRGMASRLDYIQRMGIRGVYIAGTPFLNFAWDSHQYNPLDYAILDPHLGTVREWRDLVKAIHDRGMYAMIDLTVETLTDLIQFEGFVNVSTPFNINGHKASYRRGQSYPFFQINNTWNPDCKLPQFYGPEGYPIAINHTGCYDSDFAQYGDVEAFGNVPPWVRQLGKFSGVQDRLRDWSPRVQSRLIKYTCLLIEALDIDGLRIDKTTQATVDFMTKVWTPGVRACARRIGKTNFFMPGEITTGIDLGAIYIGRGRTPAQRPPSIADALSQATGAGSQYTLRPSPEYGMDGCAFHYSIYRSILSVMGLRGDILAPFDIGADPIEGWNDMLTAIDYWNANTGVFDPRDMFAPGNQDTFRWSSIQYGSSRLRLGYFLTTLVLPGISLVYYGDEQGFYLHDSRSENYIYGRQPMTGAVAWQNHGCYTGNASYQFRGMPFTAQSRAGCHDASQSLDHFDAVHPNYLYLQQMFGLLRRVDVLVNGFGLTTLARYPIGVLGDLMDTATSPGEKKGSNGTEASSAAAAEEGIGQQLWSVVRRFLPTQLDQMSAAAAAGEPGEPIVRQPLTPQQRQSVWFVFTNSNRTLNLSGTCDSSHPIRSPFPPGSIVQDILPPYAQLAVTGINGSTTGGGCLDALVLPRFGFRALALLSSPAAQLPVIPVVTGIWPSHDTRILVPSNGSVSDDPAITASIDLVFTFSQEIQLGCDKIAAALSFRTSSGVLPLIDPGSVACGPAVGIYAGVPGMQNQNDNQNQDGEPSSLSYGVPASAYMWQARLSRVAQGILQITLDNANLLSAVNGQPLMAAVTTMYRIGHATNPLVFNIPDEYDPNLLVIDPSSSPAKPVVSLAHKAVGADLVRYSLDYGRSWSPWTAYTSSSPLVLNATTLQRSPSSSVHVIAEYWCDLCGSAAHRARGQMHLSDTTWTPYTSRPPFIPSLLVRGAWNAWGTDQGAPGRMTYSRATNRWQLSLIADFPLNATMDIWGDSTVMYGDGNRDGVLDRLPPNAQDVNVFALPVPPFGYTGWRLSVDDRTWAYRLEATGSVAVSLLYFLLLAVVPVCTAVAATWTFRALFYRVVWNRTGRAETDEAYAKAVRKARRDRDRAGGDRERGDGSVVAATASGDLPTILMATLEYEIPDWAIKVRIGGLGVIATLLGTELRNRVIWVVPKVGDVVYPAAEHIDPITVTIANTPYLISAYRHVYLNITFILLDAGVFRTCTRKDPYPPRMDDLASAVYYSAWNQAIAEVVRREQPDVYHINDFHGGIAQLYLLADTPARRVPCALSLHNAEFQGLWPIRTQKELERVCAVFNVSIETCNTYVRYGNTFNLLHGAARYITVHQHGVGAGGVSDRYGSRCHARYPTLWSLSSMLPIQNPNPQDKGADTDSETRPLLPQPPSSAAKHDNNGGNDDGHDNDVRAAHAEAKMRAQEWAGLAIDPSLTLLTFVGRLSHQKGIDLIADLAPHLLHRYPQTQLLCVGPVIDMHGSLAAAKLARTAALYPTRCFIRPEFTALPAHVFSGTDFVLLPSRDEPFGLVAVEFGRQGCLGIGSFVGGLGSMPGWWYPIESGEVGHLLAQFAAAVVEALASSDKTQMAMREQARGQRFPVAEWRRRVEEMHARVMDAAGVPRVHRSGGSDLVVARTGEPVDPFVVMDVPHASTDRDQRGHESRTDAATPAPHSVVSSASAAAAAAVLMPRTPRAADSEAGLPRPPFNTPTATISLDAFAESDFSDNHDGDNGNHSDDDDIIKPIKPGPSGVHGIGRHAELIASGVLVQTGSSSSVDRIIGGGSSSGAAHTPIRSLDTACLRSIPDIVDGEPFAQFTDESGAMHAEFNRALETLSHRNTLTDRLCISLVISRAEKQFFVDRQSAARDAAISASPPWSVSRLATQVLQSRIAGWPVYAILLALGQLMSATTFQLVLLTSSLNASNASTSSVVTIGLVFLAATGVWWTLFTVRPSITCLASPLALYGVALILAAVSAPLQQASGSSSPAPLAQWTAWIALWIYVCASASGPLFFALNFGEEAGVEMHQWILRAGVFEGLRQLWTMGLWYWRRLIPGAVLAGEEMASPMPLGVTLALLAVGMLLIGLCALVSYGLPACYRSLPPSIPGFVSTFLRRRLVLWYLASEFLRSFWLSGAIGRNLQFLWSRPLPPLGVLALVLASLGVWGSILAALAVRSKVHSWLLPVFAVGLLSPRWAQMSWATSSTGSSLAWMGPVGSYLSLSLWLWLGVLDAVQAVGLLMMLMQTLTRMHVAGVLMLGQSVAAIAFMIAKVAAPNRDGPGDVFPDLGLSTSAGSSDTSDDGAFLNRPWFWLGMVSQLVVAIGFLVWFRREQLSKP